MRALKAQGDRDPQPVLADALPLLFYVTIHGADSGNTRAMTCDRLIQPLGDFDGG